MSVLRSTILAGALASLVHGFTQPTTASWGPLLTPDVSSPVTQGQTYNITWDPASHPTDGVTVSIVLCSGPSSNCVTASSAIVEGIPAAQKSYAWAVPCSLPAGTASTETGHGLLIIVDGTGEFQYSTQFSVLANPECSSSSSANSTDTTTVSASASTSAAPESLTAATSASAPATTPESTITSESSASTPTASPSAQASAGWTTVAGTSPAAVYPNGTVVPSSSSSWSNSTTATSGVSTGAAHITTGSSVQTLTSALATSSSTNSTVSLPAATGAAVPAQVGNAVGVFGAALLAALFAF